MGRAFDLELERRLPGPRIWRGVRVPADLTLADLHRVIQVVMQWDDVHPHVFDVGGRDAAEYRGVVTDTIGAADDADIVDFLGAVMDVQRMISALTQPVERKYAISDRALGIIFLVHAGLDRPGLLHEYLNVLRSTITSDVDELVAAGLLRRKRSDTDRRVTRIEVTSKGARVQRETLRQLQEFFRARAAGVVLEELHDCIDDVHVRDPPEKICVATSRHAPWRGRVPIVASSSLFLETR